MKNVKRRAELIVRWRFTEGRRARAVWIDGQPEAGSHLIPAAHFAEAGKVRRLI